MPAVAFSSPARASPNKSQPAQKTKCCARLKGFVLIFLSVLYGNSTKHGAPPQNQPLPRRRTRQDRQRWPRFFAGSPEHALTLIDDRPAFWNRYLDSAENRFNVQHRFLAFDVGGPKVQFYAPKRRRCGSTRKVIKRDTAIHSSKHRILVDGIGAAIRGAGRRP